jgi:hypothetical protein
MRTRLLALSAAGLMLLASSLPALASSETLSCESSSTVGKKAFTFSFTATADSSYVNSIAHGATTYTLPNGTVLLVVSTTTDSSGNVTSFTATASTGGTNTTTVTCTVQ